MSKNNILGKFDFEKNESDFELENAETPRNSATGTDSSEADSSEADSSEVDSSKVDSSKVDSSEVDSSINYTEIDNSLINIPTMEFDYTQLKCIVDNILEDIQIKRENDKKEEEKEEKIEKEKKEKIESSKRNIFGFKKSSKEIEEIENNEEEEKKKEKIKLLEENKLIKIFNDNLFNHTKNKNILTKEEKQDFLIFLNTIKTLTDMKESKERKMNCNYEEIEDQSIRNPNDGVLYLIDNYGNANIGDCIGLNGKYYYFSDTWEYIPIYDFSFFTQETALPKIPLLVKIYNSCLISGNKRELPSFVMKKRLVKFDGLDVILTREYREILLNLHNNVNFYVPKYIPKRKNAIKDKYIESEMRNVLLFLMQFQNEKNIKRQMKEF
jgi:hypothetical protein